jgi:hypothetical protein
LPTFLYPWLAVAGAVAAAVPVIVHLLNRRKFRVVHWAAMDFLREALTRSRKMMELRDLLLLLLRVACLLFFGLAMARPIWNRNSQVAFDPNQPVHAVVLVDNSLSMSYQRQPAGILLDDAKAKAKDFMEGLPAGSVISVLPTCGADSGLNFEAYARREDALDALDAIRPVDCAAHADQVIARALKASHRPTGLAGKRIYLVTDQQVANWSAEGEKENLKQLPCPMQIEQVTPDQIENVWVQDVQLRDGMANRQSPAVFIATIGYDGSQPRKGIPVVLKVDGKQIASQPIDLQPGQLREVVFPEYDFAKAPVERSGPAAVSAPAARSGFATVEVSIGGDPAAFDRLPGDNVRVLVVPVVDSLPVVFVDALGKHEDSKRKIFGDTFWLRRWLAPQSGVPGQDRPLVQVRQLSMDELDRKALADARLVVIAGVAKPSPEAVAILKDYVEQGGNILLAAGGGFDPAVWSQVAWQNGLGILPAPLSPACVGYAREDRRWATSKAPPLSIKFDSLAVHYFRPEGVSDDFLREALGPPTYFHKVVVAQCDAAAAQIAVKAAADYFAAKRDKLASIDAQLASLETAAGNSQQKIADLRQERDKIQPAWLTWKPAGTLYSGSARGDANLLPVKDLADAARPQVLARYNNDLPMLVRRRWGQGQVLFLTTSLSRDWTTLHELPQSAWLMDRISRCILSETLTAWNASSEKGLVLPIAAGDRGNRFTLVDPGGKAQSLSVDALGGDLYGIGLNDLTQRGIYRVKAQRGDTAAGSSQDAASPESGPLLWEIPVAVNGPAAESELVPVAKSGAEGKSFVDVSAQAYSVSPQTQEGIGLWKWLSDLLPDGLRHVAEMIAAIAVWKWLMGLMLALLLAELLLAARSASRGEARA